MNTYDQLKAAVAQQVLPRGKAIGIAWQGSGDSHSLSGMKWEVFSPFFKTYPTSPWYDHGCATFMSFNEEGKDWREKKAKALTRAFAWAKKHYGITEWERNGSGDYVPKP